MARGGSRVAIGIALASVASLIACGGKMGRPMQAAAPDAMMRPSDSRAEIDRLSADIAAREQTAGATAPDGAAIEAAQPMSIGDVQGVCAAPLTPPPACTDVCTLGTAICDDARSICRLADDLIGDAWAAERCDAGKASCQAAQQRCCDCH